MTFSVIYTTRARRDLTGLPREVAQRCIRAISGIKEDPYAHLKKLGGAKTAPLYTLRIGRYRAIMSIEGARLFIFVLEIGHRSTINRKY